MEVMSFQQTDFNFNTRCDDDFAQEFENKLKMSEAEEEEEELIVDDDDYEDDGDFSFAGVNRAGSPISAEDVFEDGQIRPVFPIFGRDINEISGVKKIFVEEQAAATSDPAGPFCEWRGKTVHEASPDRCRKSNSTGFSKLRRFRERVLKSNSDGKDAFVFLNDAATDETEIRKKKSKNKDETTPLTAYLKSKAKQNDKRKLYLPYKQVGFFTNVNGLTRNVHPF